MASDDRVRQRVYHIDAMVILVSLKGVCQFRARLLVMADPSCSVETCALGNSHMMLNFMYACCTCLREADVYIFGTLPMYIRWCRCMYLHVKAF